jgi:hypothetical protein
MNRNIVIVIVIVIVLAVLVYAGFRLLGSGTTPVTTQPGTGGLPGVLPTATSTPPTGETITIGTPQGGVTVKNPYKGAAEVHPNWGALSVSTDTYDMLYFSVDSSFLMTFKKMPFDQLRKVAEADFLERLGITREQACKLKVIEAVPYSVDPTLAGKSFGLSFCGIGVQ